MSFLPDDVEAQLAIGLRTGDADSRLQAVVLANRADAERYYQSMYGSHTVARFMDQMGIDFIATDQPAKTKEWARATTREDAVARFMITQAIGDQIGLDSKFYRLELIKEADEYDSTTLVLMNGTLFSGESLVSDTFSELDQEKDYWIEYFPVNNKAFTNCARAIRAVQGRSTTGFRPDTDWFTMMEDVRALQEGRA